MNYEPEVIRARFVEAAFTERYLPNAKLPSARGFWPVCVHDHEDYGGYDDQARLDNASVRVGRASMGAVSRHQECLDWTCTIIKDEKRRHIVWSWAFCRANGWDFRARCVRRGWARPTAYRRLSASFEQILDRLRNERSFLHLPEEKWLRQEIPVMASSCGTPESRDKISVAIKYTPGYRTEPSRDTLDSLEKIADFIKHRDRTNAERRRFQERLEAKRRKKLGIGAS